MPGEISVPLPTLFGFLLVLVRVSGVIIFVPIPGMQGLSEAARVFLALGLTITLMPAWPQLPVAELSMARLPAWIGAEFAFGLLIGVALSLLLEGLQLAAQMVGLQAGYSFASTIDPTTQADVAVLQIITQLFAGFLFFALGLDREVVRVLAMSLDHIPAVALMTRQPVMDAVVRLGSQIFISGLRLAMPVLALLILMDLSFAIMGKVHSQFQIMSLSFAAKMLAGMALFAITLAAFPRILQSAATHTFEVLVPLLGR